MCSTWTTAMLTSWTKLSMGYASHFMMTLRSTRGGHLIVDKDEIAKLMTAIN
jgi:hypothetical protein